MPSSGRFVSEDWRVAVDPPRGYRFVAWSKASDGAIREAGGGWFSLGRIDGDRTYFAVFSPEKTDTLVEEEVKEIEKELAGIGAEIKDDSASIHWVTRSIARRRLVALEQKKKLLQYPAGRELWKRVESLLQSDHEFDVTTVRLLLDESVPTDAVWKQIQQQFPGLTWRQAKEAMQTFTRMLKQERENVQSTSLTAEPPGRDAMDAVKKLVAQAKQMPPASVVNEQDRKEVRRGLPQLNSWREEAEHIRQLMKGHPHQLTAWWASLSTREKHIFGLFLDAHEETMAETIEKMLRHRELPGVTYEEIYSVIAMNMQRLQKIRDETPFEEERMHSPEQTFKGALPKGYDLFDDPDVQRQMDELFLLLQQLREKDRSLYEIRYNNLDEEHLRIIPLIERKDAQGLEHAGFSGKDLLLIIIEDYEKELRELLKEPHPHGRKDGRCAVCGEGHLRSTRLERNKWVLVCDNPRCALVWGDYVPSGSFLTEHGQKLLAEEYAKYLSGRLSPHGRRRSDGVVIPTR